MSRASVGSDRSLRFTSYCPLFRISPVMIRPRSIIHAVSLVIIAAFFTFAGVGHFTNAEFFLNIMPPYLPFHLALVYISGVFEVIGGVGVLLPSLRRSAGWGLVALLIAVFPANIHMAMNPDQFNEMPYWGLLLRLPIQFVAMYWVYRSAIRFPNSSSELALNSQGSASSD